MGIDLHIFLVNEEGQLTTDMLSDDEDSGEGPMEGRTMFG